MTLKEVRNVLASEESNKSRHAGKRRRRQIIIIIILFYSYKFFAQWCILDLKQLIYQTRKYLRGGGNGTKIIAGRGGSPGCHPPRCVPE